VFKTKSEVQYRKLSLLFMLKLLLFIYLLYLGPDLRIS